jgi:lipopolysaccharide/colanic/teichoic acid biosynthesis glycosyltransferase
MELATLPATNKNKTYKHYTLHSLPPENAAYVKTEFYYIGSDPRIIDSLIKTFESGYATESFVNAKNMLLRLQQQGHPAPHIIICDSQLGYEGISEFRTFLNRQDQLAYIPFVLDDRGMAEEMKLRLRKDRIVDEIVVLTNYNKKTLQSKARFLNRIKSESANHAWRNKIETSTATGKSNGAILKRAFDILIASLALICISPVFLLIALAIKLESRGPVFYIAKRAGRGYRIFNFYKFRTMIVGADAKMQDISHLNQYNSTEEGPKFYKIENDPRITKVGAFLRKTSLDEFPQLLNVLLGDMSLVGNRPLPLYEAATLTTDEWAQRFMAPAGMTGLWQIKKRGNKDMSVEERISLDIAYASKSNFAYDLWIMSKTPAALIQKTNV